MLDNQSSSKIFKDDLSLLLSEQSDLFSTFRNQTLFITGGTGLFGKWLLHTFLAAERKFELGLKIHVLSRNPQKFLNENPTFIDQKTIYFIEGDIRNFEFPKLKVDSIIHAATEASVQLNEEDPGLMLETILTGTQRALDFAVQSGAQKFLLTSSGGVYSRTPTKLTHIPEDYLLAPDPLNPRSAYGEGKRVSELLCSIYQRRHGIQCKIARCFGFVGPYFPLETHYAIGNFIRNSLEGNAIAIGGDGTARRSFMYMADLTEWLLVLLQNGESLKPYHIGSSHSVSILELASLVVTVAKDLQPEFPQLSIGPISVAKEAISGNLPEVYVPKIDNAESLGLKCRYPLEESIRRTFLWNLGK